MVRLTLTAAAFAVAMVVSAPTLAHACGGFFCNGAQPVDQTGEDIVFAVDDEGNVEAHILIQYQGAAEDFSWILPVPTIPEVNVGVSDLFAQLRDATVPAFSTRTRVEGTCGRSCEDFASSGAIVLPDGDPSSTAADSPRVVSESQVGPYDVAILDASDADGLFGWLTDHGYLVTEDAVPKLMEYIDADRYFVAVRLSSGRMVGEIRPLILRYRERKPCLPIELTAISTTPDMPIRVFIMGSARARPLNYAQTSVDVADPGLFMGTSSYRAAVSRAVDEAGGHAFVVEYAGPSPRIAVSVPTVDELRGAEPTHVARILEELAGVDPRAQDVARAFLIPPEGVAMDAYLACLAARDGSSCAFSRHLGRAVSIDTDALADALEAEIIAPRRRINGLGRDYPQTTRLFTTMSADEMDLDPIFELHPDVPRVVRTAVADLVISCSGLYTVSNAPRTLIPPGGTGVLVSAGLPLSNRCDAAGRPVQACAASPVGRSSGGGPLLVAALLLWRRRRRARRKLSAARASCV